MNIASALIHSARLLPTRTTSQLPPLRCYAFKSDLKIKWVRPEKIPSYKPVKSGDLSPFNQPTPQTPQAAFRHSKELETADDLVKRLFSLEFASRKHSTEVYFNEMVNKVRRHKYDAGSIEVRIAKWTGIIRTFQELMERFPRNVRLKVRLQEMIDKRKKHLKYLRRWDYKRFEWLLETLDLVYKPPPNEFAWVTRKGSLVKLTNEYCDNLKKTKLESYKAILEAEQPVFLEEKIKALEFIQNEQKECGVAVEVTQEEIDAVKDQLNKLLETKS